MYADVQPLTTPHSMIALYEPHEPTGTVQTARQHPKSPPQRRDRKTPPQNAESGRAARHDLRTFRCSTISTGEDGDTPLIEADIFLEDKISERSKVKEEEFLSLIVE